MPGLKVTGCPVHAQQGWEPALGGQRRGGQLAGEGVCPDHAAACCTVTSACMGLAGKQAVSEARRGGSSGGGSSPGFSGWVSGTSLFFPFLPLPPSVF